MLREDRSRNGRELQRNIYVLAELSGMLKRSRHDRHQSSRIEREILAVTERLEYLVQEYEYTMLGTEEQQPGVFKLVATALCPECIQRMMKSRREGKPAETKPVLPIWQSGLEFAFACTSAVANEFFDDSGTCEFTYLPACLVTLRNTLRRLQRLLPPAARETHIKIAKHSHCCAECGETIEVVS